MRYKQKDKKNQRIQLITEKTLIVGADIGAEEILRRWKTQVKRAVGIKRARKLVEYASTSIGITEDCVGAKLELEVLLDQYEFYTQQLEQTWKRSRSS